MIFTILFIFSLILMSKVIISLIINKCDNNLSFYIISIAILTIFLLLFLFYYHNIGISLILSLLLMVITYTFILDIKNKYKENYKLIIPFFLLTIFLFANIINRFLFLAHQ